MKKFKLNFLHIADFASAGESGKLNIIGIFEKVHAKEFPTRVLAMTIVGNLTVFGEGPESLFVRVESFKKNDNKSKTEPFIVLPEAKVELPERKDPANKNINLIFTVGNVLFESEGEYVFSIYLDNEKIGSVLIKAEKKDANGQSNN